MSGTLAAHVPQLDYLVNAGYGAWVGLAFWPILPMMVIVTIFGALIGWIAFVPLRPGPTLRHPEPIAPVASRPRP